MIFHEKIYLNVIYEMIIAINMIIINFIRLLMIINITLQLLYLLMLNQITLKNLDLQLVIHMKLKLVKAIDEFLIIF